MEIISKQRKIISNEDSVFSYFGWPSATRIDDNTLACVCSGYRLRHVCPYGKACLSLSYDDGLSWTPQAIVIDPPLDDRDAGIVAYDNNVIITSFNNSPEFQKHIAKKSQDAGDNSIRMKLILAYLDTYPDDYEKFLGSTYKVSHDYGKTFGELKKCDITSPHGPFLGLNGDVFWVGKKFNSVDNGDIALYKKDESDNFVFVSNVPDCVDEYGPGFACEPYGIVLPSGKMIIAIRVQRTGDHPLFTTFICYSYDNGKTFTTPKKIMSDNQGSPPHFLYHTSGTLILSYARRKAKYGIRAIVSKDEGETFSDEIVLTDDAPTSDLGYPACVERKDGSIMTIWYQQDEYGSSIRELIWKL